MLDPIIKEKIDKAFSVVVKGQTEDSIRHVQYMMNQFLKMSDISGELFATASIKFSWELMSKEEEK